MRLDVSTLNARLKAINLFIDHYFKNLNSWKNGCSTELNLSTDDWTIEIYDGLSIYETWSFDDIEDYLDENNLYVE